MIRKRQTANNWNASFNWLISLLSLLYVCATSRLTNIKGNTIEVTS